MTLRTYTKGALVVLWNSELCSHCERCWRELPSVFNPEARPWVNLDGASTQQVIGQVALCVSAALSLQHVDVLRKQLAIDGLIASYVGAFGVQPDNVTGMVINSSAQRVVDGEWYEWRQEGPLRNLVWNPVYDKDEIE